MKHTTFFSNQIQCKMMAVHLDTSAQCFPTRQHLVRLLDDRHLDTPTQILQDRQQHERLLDDREALNRLLMADRCKVFTGN